MNAFPGLPSSVRLRFPLTALALLAPAVVPLALSSSSASAPDGAVAGADVSARLLPLASPERVLPRTVGGRQALRAVGEDLPEIAALNGRTPEELSELLLGDETLVLTTTGRLAYRDMLAERSDPTSMPRTAPFPTSQTFSLESRPGSQRTIFLDFDGASGYGSYWETSAGSIDGYSLDSDPGFNAEEHAVIQEVWLRVAEDYAPFDVNVTTKDLGEAAITRNGSSDQVYGARAQITDDVQAHADLCGSEFCTGIAYIGVFDEAREHAALQPAWAFTRYFDDVASIAETVSHEVGHNLGLDHHGRGGEDYYDGHANWAPIMGSGLKPVIQWSDGSYSGATRPGQDDLAIITDDDARTLGGGLRLVPDEAGNSVQTAASSIPAAGAIITSRSDVDVFSLGSCTGTVTVRALPAPLSPNLDIELAVLDSSGTVRGSDDPLSTFGDGDTAGGMGATVTVPASGTLYARVDGVGTGSPDTAYDDYGSLGRYTLSATGCDDPGPSPTPTATPTSTPTSTPTATPGPELTVPDAPIIGNAKPGRRGGPRTASLTWSAPPDDGGSALTGYVVLAHKIGSDGRVVRTLRSAELEASPTRGEFRMPRGRWSYQVLALNALGESQPSDFSRVVKPR